MGTVRTSILVEVDERINDLVVKPHKQHKTFGKLIAALLTGYVEDEYFRAYADGTISNLRKASVDALDSVIDSMSSSLSNMGMLGMELRNNTETGIKHFTSVKQEKEKSMQEYDSLKQDVDELRSQNTQILKMLELLSTGLTSGNTVPAQTIDSTVQSPVANVTQKVSEPAEEVPKISEEVEETVYETTQEEVQEEVQDEIKVSPVVNTTVQEMPTVEEEDDDDEDLNAGDLLSSLMVGNQYSF